MKKWMLTRNILKSYKEQGYLIVDYGSCYVNPNNIIALCHPLEYVLSDGKMERLEQSVYHKGWINKKGFYDLHLLLLPDILKYVVYSGGNHRSYLSNKLGIYRIKAFITIMLPVKKIKKDVLDSIAAIEEILKKYDEESQFLNENLKEIGYVNLEHPLYRKYDVIGEKMDALLNKREALLKAEAIRLGVIPRFAEMSVKLRRKNKVKTMD